MSHSFTNCTVTLGQSGILVTVPEPVYADTARDALVESAVKAYAEEGSLWRVHTRFVVSGYNKKCFERAGRYSHPEYPEIAPGELLTLVETGLPNRAFPYVWGDYANPSGYPSEDTLLTQHGVVNMVGWRGFCERIA